jgi:hypothetical protein
MIFKPIKKLIMIATNNIIKRGNMKKNQQYKGQETLFLHPLKTLLHRFQKLLQHIKQNIPTTSAFFMF